jgi:DNA mismatch repair protein MSH6
MTDRVNMRMVGVPEATFEMWAARFVAAGYKIARVDQVETAIGKSIREKESESKAEKIIRRELTCILTAGTITEPSMLGSDSASYCVAIKEKTCNDANVEIGLAIVDAAGGSFKLCDFQDDGMRAILETILMQLQPKEIILEKGSTSSETTRAIKTLLPAALITEAVSDKEFWGKSKITNELDMGQYFSCWPDTLKSVHDASQLSFLAFGALLWYLRELKLDRGLLSYQNFAILKPDSSSMVLDGQTLLNLDILPSPLRSSISAVDQRKGTLLGVIDYCSTPFGKRLLSNWLCHPLCRVNEINARLDVVEYFLNVPGLVDSFTEMLKTLPDLERTLSRIHTGSIRLKEFIATIDAFKTITRLANLVGSQEVPCLLKSVLAEIPEYSAVIDYYLSAFDRQLALKEGSFSYNIPTLYRSSHSIPGN